MYLTDKQWEVLAALLPPLPVRPDRRGRPWSNPRLVLDGILWILRTGAQWKHLPREYPPYQTCHRWFQQWSRDGTWRRIVRALAQDLLARGKLDLEEGFVDGSFSGAKKGALELVRRSAVKGPRSWQLQTALVFLSPPALRMLRPTKSGSSKRRLTRASSMNCRTGSLATKPMTAIDSTSDSGRSEGLS